MNSQTNVNGGEQELPTGWPHEEDRMILGFLGEVVRGQVLLRSFELAPLGVRLGELIDWQLQQFYSLLAHGNASLKGVFSEEELLLLADACNANSFGPESVSQEVVFNVRDYLAYYLQHAEGFGVDSYQFLAKLEELDTLARYSLVDVIGRWWALDDDSRSVTITSLIEGTPDPEKCIHIRL